MDFPTQFDQGGESLLSDTERYTAYTICLLVNCLNLFRYQYLLLPLQTLIPPKQKDAMNLVF
ncbi:hypothetical protein LEP1GSC196_2602 [Leptospira meyeri serovar Semaranga str. Veldrot Semarang 173]|nr:hypothetical protein LEP1GSC196_2602 [Leptospira meyeri serovar Semaranga str. Veldrot Semarang 173]